ncbi:hypothetical protein BDY21DRAFT_141308 [Lineolata rhizophorae]|uniref:Uncharacterized protein n=1 Tax=Lineolata rhizophorae TaxID=578093 RepID=A0A6A6NN97_9PEZI|nr:hypothetical protein BDY21DRAFT_141308 [Lineolata rhizophorae]
MLGPGARERGTEAPPQTAWRLQAGLHSCSRQRQRPRPAPVPPPAACHVSQTLPADNFDPPPCATPTGRPRRCCRLWRLVVSGKMPGKRKAWECMPWGLGSSKKTTRNGPSAANEQGGWHACFRVAVRYDCPRCALVAVRRRASAVVPACAGGPECGGAGNAAVFHPLPPRPREPCIAAQSTHRATTSRTRAAALLNALAP